ncbi:double zinc ribbon domain-containing protein [Oleiharenicola lentus]|uniref:double zinc ribbon domain-containing protein n=1 Tax=Oleiharenicola lentus TaxID=2508720 RepID=UPI003F67BDF0
MTSVLQQLWRDKLDVVFPRSCIDCGDAVEGGRFRHVCIACEKKLFVVEPPHCTTCGHPFFGETDVNRLCPHCELLEPKFREGKTAVLLKGPGRALVHALKYHHGLHVLEDLVAIMREVPGYADYVRGAVLVPVPLHPRKLRERRYNQSTLLAECCVKACDGQATVQELLKRIVDTESQTHYDRATRQKNLKNAFALARSVKLNPASRYILVDDVFTTGSTLNSCAAVLRRAGLTNLDVITFGHG